MNRQGKFGGVLAGVSLIALSISFGPVPAFAGDYVIDTDVINVEITNDLDGSVINNAVVGNGGNDFGIKVRNDAVVSGDLVNNGTVTAGYTAWGADAQTSVAGIVVWSGGQVDGQVVNNGTVNANAGAYGAVAAAQAYGIVTEGDANPDILNSEGASVSAGAIANGDDHAFAIAGGIGEGVGSVSATGLLGLTDVGGSGQSANITNEGSVNASASAKIISGGEFPLSSHQATALAFGAGQLVAASEVDAAVTNASGADISVSADAEARSYATDTALAAGGGVLQVALGGNASGMVSNQGNIDVGVSAYATSTDGGEGGNATAGGLGVGSAQLVAGVAGTGAADMVNDGEIGVDVASRAVAANGTALSGAAGIGALQVAYGMSEAGASVTNTGEIGASADATATANDLAVAGAAALGNVQAAASFYPGSAATAEMDNSGSISADASAEANGEGLSIAAAGGAGNVQLALSEANSQATNSNSGDIGITTDASATGGIAAAGVDGLGNAQVAIAFGSEGTTSAQLTNDGSISSHNSAEAQGSALGVAAAIGGGNLQVAAGGGNATAVATNDGSIDVGADAEASGAIAVAVGASYGNAQAALGIGADSASSASMSNDGSISVADTAVAEGSVAIGVTNSAGNIQLAAGGGDATAVVENTGDIDVSSDASATGAFAVAAAGGYGNAQAALAVGPDSESSADFTNDGSISLDTSAEAQGTLAAVALANSAGNLQLAAGGGNATATGENTGDIGVTSDLTATADYAVASGGGYGNAQIALALGEEGAASADFDNDGSISIDTSSEAHGTTLGVAAAISGGNAQVAAGRAGATATGENEGTIDADSNATASGDLAFAVGAGYGNAQGALALGAMSASSATFTNSGSISSHHSAAAQGTTVGAAAAVSAGNVQLAAGGGNATAVMNNAGEIDVSSDATAAGGFAVAVGAGYGNGQGALAIGSESVASADFSNDGSVNVENSADAQGSLLGVAIGEGVGSRQLAVSAAGSVASTTNNGTIDVDLEASAAVTSASGYAVAVTFGVGAAQASLALFGPADAAMTNNGSVEVESVVSATGGAVSFTDAVADGTLQIAGSYANTAAATLTNGSEASIDAEAEADASGLYQVKADSYVIGAGQIVISGMMDASAGVTNSGHINANAVSNGTADAAAGFVESEADAAAIDQLVVSGGETAVAYMSVTNTSAINATATANASAASALAEGRAQGINQYGLGNNVSQSVNNSGDITVEANATAGGVNSAALASALGVVQAGLAYNATATLINTGNITAQAEATSNGTTIGNASAGAIGQLVRQPLELLMPVPPASANPVDLPDGVDPGTILAGATPVELPDDMTSVTGGNALPGVDASAAVAPQGAYTTLALDVENAAGASITASAHAVAVNDAVAFAAGGWYEAQLGGMSGTVENAGMIMATAVAAGSAGTAQAFGVTEITSSSNATVLSNTGAIMALAVGPTANATGVAVASFAPVPTALNAAPAPVDAVSVINNEGGAIWAAVSTDAGTTIHRGDAISTRGGFASYAGYPTIEAYNAVEINLQGGGDGSIGKDFVIEHNLASGLVQTALMGDANWGYVYGNIQITADDTVNVTDGVTIFDGVVNAGTEPGVGTFNVNDGGKLVMVQNRTDGASVVNVAEFNMDSTGTLVYELSADAEPGAYAQVIAGTANVDGGNLVALYHNDLYADRTVYDNVIAADALTGSVSVEDNSPLLITKAVNDGDNNIDLLVKRVAFNDVAGLTSNQKAVGGAIEKVYNKLDGKSDFSRMVANMFTLDDSQYKNVLGQLSGAEYAQHLQSVLWSTRAINHIVSERMECTDGAAYVKTSDAAKVGDKSVVPTADAPMGSAGCFQPGQASVWARGFGQWNNLSGDNNAPGVNEDQYGFLFGADYAFNEDLFLGVAGGYFNSNGNFDDWYGRDGAAINYDGLQLAAYGGYDNSVYYLRGVVSYGSYQGDSERSFDFPGSSPVRLSGDPSSDTWSFYGETGYRFAVGGMGSLTPFAGLSIATASLNGFTEDQSEGNAAALEIHDSNANSVASVLGARFEANVPMGSGVFTPAVSVSWMHEFDNTAQEVNMSFAGAPSGADFTVKGSEVARDSVLLDAGAKFSVNDAVDFGVFYNGQYNADYTSNAVTARIGYKF